MKNLNFLFNFFEDGRYKLGSDGGGDRRWWKWRRLTVVMMLQIPTITRWCDYLDGGTMFPFINVFKIYFNNKKQLKISRRVMSSFQGNKGLNPKQKQIVGMTRVKNSL